jgi:hypothetical protein
MNDYAAAYNTSPAHQSKAGQPQAGQPQPNPPQAGTGLEHFVQTSQYFRLTSHITIGTAEFDLYSLLQRDDSTGAVRPILRSYSPD